MFSERYRWIKIGGIGLLLLLLAGYSDRRNRFLTFAQCLNDPERYAGAEVHIFPDPRVIALTGDRLLVSQPGGPLEIRIPEGFAGVFPAGSEISDLKPGDPVEALAVFRLPGYLELKLIRGTHLRRYKIILSIFPVLLVGFFLLRTVRWKNGFLTMKSDGSDGSDRSDKSGEPNNF